MSAEEIPGPVPARPWRPEDGPRPKVTTWPPGKEPALEVWTHGRWRYASFSELAAYGPSLVACKVLSTCVHCRSSR